MPEGDFSITLFGANLYRRPGNEYLLFPICTMAHFCLPCLPDAPSSAHAAENEVVVISPHQDAIKEETSRAFSAWHEKTYGRPAIIRWKEAGGGGSQIVRFLRAEYQTSPSAGIDVLYGGGVDPFHELKKDNLLTRYDPPADILAQIPAQLNGMEILDPDHDWFGTCLSGFGIITNERVRQTAGLPEVHTWADLTDPQPVQGLDFLHRSARIGQRAYPSTRSSCNRTAGTRAGPC